VIAIATDGDELVQGMADHVLWVPETPWMLSPAITVLPLQFAGLPHCIHPRIGCGPAEEPGKKRDRGVRKTGLFTKNLSRFKLTGF